MGGLGVVVCMGLEKGGCVGEVVEVVEVGEVEEGKVEKRGC